MTKKESNPVPENRRISATLLGRCAMLLALIGLPLTANSQQWQFEPVVKVRAEYDDNIRLTPDDASEISSSAFTLDAKGGFVRRAQSSELRFAPRVRAKTYSDSLLENTNDIFVDLFGVKRLETSSYGLQTRFAREDVLTAELDDPDFDNPDVNTPVNLDTGRLRIGSERDSLIVSPFFRHQWTETVGFGINADYIDVTYDEAEQNFTDYTSINLRTNLSYRISDRSTWLINVFGSDYEADAGNSRNSESQTVGAGLEFRHKFSQTMEGRVAVGYQDVDSDVTSGATTISDSNTITVYSAGLTKQGDISRVVVDASQTIDPGGTGFLLERTQFRLRYTRQLSPKMYGEFNARLQTAEEVSPNQAAAIDRDFQRYGVGLEWRITRIWSVKGEYEFTSQEFDGAAGTAKSNEVSVSFVYEPARRR